MLILLSVLLCHARVSIAAAPGLTLTYATYLGGSYTAPTENVVSATAVDSQGNIYLAGSSTGGIPTTPGSYQPQINTWNCSSSSSVLYPCPDAFVAKLSPAKSLIWATYIGGKQDRASAIAVDASGNVYVAGMTASDYFPITSDALQKTSPDPNGPYMGAFLLKLDPSGARLLYSTLLGAQWDAAYALALSPAGDLYVAGYAESGLLPLRNALRPVSGGGDCSSLPEVKYPCGDAFIMRWRASEMTLLASTLLGGNGDDSANAVALDRTGNVYLTGRTSSTDFPLKNALQPTVSSANCQSDYGQAHSACPDAFVTKFSADLSSVLYSTRLGGDDADIGNAIAVDANGSIVIAGATQSRNFPTANAFQPQLAAPTCYVHNSVGSPVEPCSAGFIAKLAPDGASLVYSSYIGGAVADEADALAVDASGTAYVGGQTGSRTFPITSNAIQHCNPVSYDTGATTAFVTAISPGGQIAWSTYLGGSGGEQVQALAAGQGVLFVAGYTASHDFPVTPDAVPSGFPLNYLGFLAILDLTRGYTGPHVEPVCVVNSASYHYTAVTPGEIVSVFGQNLGPEGGTGATLDAQGRIAKSLAGVIVTFDGIPAPLLWAGPDQVNAIVPFGVSGKTTQLVVNYQNAATQPTTLSVAPAAPGIFTYPADTQAVAINQDGTLNGPSNPAPRGSIVALWMTGAGPLSQSYADGQIVEGTAGMLATLVSTPHVYFGGLGTGEPPGLVPEGRVVYAGQAPDLVAGAVQLNFVVPLDAPVGQVVPVYVVGPGVLFLFPPISLAVQ